MSWAAALRTRPAVQAWTLLLFLSLLWGSSFILIKKGVQVYTPLQVGTLRILAAAVFMVPFGVPLIRRGVLQQLSRAQWVFLVFAGFTGSLIPAIFFSIAGQHIPSALSGALNALTPLFTFLIGAVWLGLQVRTPQLIGVVLGLLGSVLLLTGGFTFGFAGRVNLYAGFVVLAALCYAVNISMVKRFLHGVRPVHISALSLLAVGLPAAVVLFSTDFVTRTVQAPGAGLALSGVLLLGVVNTAIALIFYYQLIQLSTPIFASSTTYVIPIVALAWGLLDGESLQPAHLVGMVTVVGGVLLINRGR
ncbi:Uncharacterized membrane protein [Catalinimonas alkaloidigena]|uniref:Uncharacterized membrane protein n=1 Tax=Catalinimonas alkaloidigena TaxID=1075417 RepID=A0A1G9F4M0_9BACT|nr:DMT family transporter [Catalinimonas alkaloidigena]SDK83290.1 Uncharacterized membrane protein [Catalinimonas alkaloidigena]